jgi:MFS family permease
LARPQVLSTVGLLALATIVLATSLESVSGPFVVGGYTGYSPVHLALTVAAWPVLAAASSLLLRAEWGARRGTLVIGAALIGTGLLWLALADSWSYGLIGFALAGSGNGVVNIALSAAIWGALQRAAWSAFNFMLAVMLIIGFGVGSTAAAGQAPRVVFAGGALTLAANAAYLLVLRARRTPADAEPRTSVKQVDTRRMVKAP